MPDPDYVLINTELLALQVIAKLNEKRGPMPEVVKHWAEAWITDVVIVTVSVLIEDLELGKRLDE